MSKKQFNFRFPPDLISWVDSHAKENGTDRTGFVQGLIEAAREGRIRTVDRAGMNPFPGEQVRAGETEEYPILVCLTPFPPSIQE
jgi:hypothetical protein